MCQGGRARTGGGGAAGHAHEAGRVQSGGRRGLGAARGAVHGPLAGKRRNARRGAAAPRLLCPVRPTSCVSLLPSSSSTSQGPGMSWGRAGTAMGEGLGGEASICGAGRCSCARNAIGSLGGGWLRAGAARLVEVVGDAQQQRRLLGEVHKAISRVRRRGVRPCRLGLGPHRDLGVAPGGGAWGVEGARRCSARPGAAARARV